MRKVQSTAWEGARSGGGASSDVRMTADEETRPAAAWMSGGAAMEVLAGTADSDAGDGLLGDNRQQFGACAEPSVTAVCATADFAIIGQCGGQCSEAVLALLQQRLTAAAGPANSPNNKKKATSLDRIFTSKTCPRIPAQN